MKKSIILFGAYGEGNIGDDLLLETLIKAIESSGNQYDVFIAAGKNKTYLKKAFPDCKIISKAIAKRIPSDFFILGGGTQFFDFGSKKKPKFSKLLALVRFIRTDLKSIKYLVASKTSITDQKKLAIGIGLGPFSSRTAEERSLLGLANYDMVLCRDTTSSKLCEKYGINSHMYSDICFSSIFAETYNFTHPQNESFKVGIVLRDWVHNDVGQKINLKILDWIKANPNLAITPFVFSKDKDSNIVSTLSELNLPIKIWDPSCMSATSYLSSLAEMDVLITSRFHAAVFAAAFQIPAICLGIDPKLELISNEVDSFKYLNCDDDFSQINALLSQYRQSYIEFQSSIRLSTYNLRLKSDEMLSKFVQTLQKQ